MEDEPRAGRPSTSKTDDNVERVRSLVRSDRRLMLRMISSELNFWTTLRVSQNSSVALSQVMNHGFWSTTPRQNAKVRSGTLQTLPVPRKREWANPKLNRRSFVFLTVSGSSTRNLCHQDKLAIKLFIRKSVKDSGKGWHMCDQALHTLGCFTTTTPHVTWQSPSMNFWQKKAFLWFLSPPIRQISVPVTSFYSPGSKTT